MTGRSARLPRKEAKPKWQTHVYLDEADFKALVAIAEAETRSTTGQVMHFIKAGIAEYRKRNGTP